MNFKFKLSKRLAQSHACLFLALALGACEIERFLTDPPVDTSDNILHRVASVTVTPASASGTVGQSAQFTAVLKDSAGDELTGRTVAWSSSAPAVVTVTPTGLGTAVSVGSASVVATSEGMQGAASMTVSATPPPPPPPPPPPQPPGTVTDLAVTGATDSSVALAFTEVTDGTGQPASYEVRFALPALAWGTANAVVRGTCVSPMAGSTIGNRLTCTALGLAAATTYEFQLIAFRGTLNVDAVFGGLSNVARGTTGAPAPAPVGSVTVSPSSASLGVGTSQQFSATLRDASGNVLTGRTITWSSSNPVVAAVLGTGLVTGLAAGSATISATSEGQSGTAAVTVTTSPPPPPPPPPVASVTVSPSSASLTLGGTQQFTATLKDAAGNVLTGRTVTWSSSAPTVASVTATGLGTGLLAGSATITATSEGQSGSAGVTVTALPPPPPPPPGWPNAPGYPAISDQPWDLLTALGWNLNNGGGNATISVDAAAPLSAPNVIQFRYPAGFTGGSAPATAWRGLPNLRRIFVGLWWKASNPWQGHPSNVNKIQFMFPSSGGDIYMAMYGAPGGPYELRVLPQFPGLPSNWFVPNVTQVPVTLGQWHRIEWLIDYGTGGNGVLQWWLDGVLLGDYRNVTYPSGGLIEYQLSPTWGGIGDVKAQTDYFWYDHVFLSGN